VPVPRLRASYGHNAAARPSRLGDVFGRLGFEFTIAWTQSHSTARCSRYPALRRFTSTQEHPMADNSMTGSFQIKLPKDLLTEAQRRLTPKQDQLHVDGWKNSWLTRLSEILVGHD
jgi:hypothetical protein